MSFQEIVRKLLHRENGEIYDPRDAKTAKRDAAIEDAQRRIERLGFYRDVQSRRGDTHQGEENGQ